MATFCTFDEDAPSPKFSTCAEALNIASTGSLKATSFCWILRLISEAESIHSVTGPLRRNVTAENKLMTTSTMTTALKGGASFVSEEIEQSG
jgi:hypothetical protein